MLKCTINGQEVEVKEGTSIIEAFTLLDQDIAHYCWHPGLSVAGVCRLCMVEIEGNPRLQIACNTPVQDGMVISNQSEMVKDAVKWGLDFHLINHPLDCPICDQAGECGLQDQYMKFGQYDSEMSQQKVKKKKVVDLGDKIVLDSERCILCSRCVRFTEEVSKTNELGIFNRGDHSEIGTYAGKPLNNDYAVNTVDICPVGALTSKDFRFRQRVWFLKDKPSVCTGCSTGCSVDVHYNKEGVWRVKPRPNDDVNGYWMCDHGREIYKATNTMNTEFVGERGNKKAIKVQNRLTQAMTIESGNKTYQNSTEAVKALSANLAATKKAALVLTGQYSNEEYKAILDYWKSQFGGDNVYHWLNHKDQVDEFDGLLIRGDKNPNTNGLKNALQAAGITAKTDLPDFANFDWVVVAGPENQWCFDDITEVAAGASKASHVIWLSAGRVLAAEQAGSASFIPMKTTVEKSGSFTNHAGQERSFEKVDIFVEQALSMLEVVSLLLGQDVQLDQPDKVESVGNEFTYEKDERGSYGRYTS